MKTGICLFSTNCENNKTFHGVREFLDYSFQLSQRRKIELYWTFSCFYCWKFYKILCESWEHMAWTTSEPKLSLRIQPELNQNIARATSAAAEYWMSIYLNTQHICNICIPACSSATDSVRTHHRSLEPGSSTAISLRIHHQTLSACSRDAGEECKMPGCKQ